MRLPIRLWIALLWAAAVAAPPLAAQASAESVAADLQMAGASAPFREVAERFVARSMAGDVAAAQSMLSRALVQRTGEAAVERALQAQIVPFFQQGRLPGRSVTVTQTTDAAGQRGYAFYMWMQEPGGAGQRPFALYMVQEGGRIVVANVVPDRLVEGRHR